ncbi:MAG: Uroporphyrinogen-III C-methyltransferase [Anaerolineae bacterium]|nr:Uroporphyrinogen-III C-methyltransferase [Anaerolineae bacterium]
MTGKAYLIGAGPGRADLITVRGLNLLRRAEVVVYDRLIAPELLAEAPAGAELVFVGKESGKHTLPQSKINALLVERVRAGRQVVRLKGGDPFVFGRGGEEALALAEAGLPFEIVPGVTASVAVPAFAGVPVTHRGVARSFAVITGHHASGMPKIDTDWRVFGNIPTLVILMGVKRIRHIARDLMAAGRPADTPAMAIQSGATDQQFSVTATLETLPDAFDAAGITTPAIIVIGEVVRLAGQLSWFQPDGQTSAFVPLGEGEEE